MARGSPAIVNMVLFRQIARLTFSMPHPHYPPYVAIEVLSADDRRTEVVGKLREYGDFGVAHAWVVDPELKTLYVFDSDGLHQVRSLRIPEFGIHLTPREIFEAQRGRVKIGG